jgi:hypothetical protein
MRRRADQSMARFCAATLQPEQTPSASNVSGVAAALG